MHNKFIVIIRKWWREQENWSGIASRNGVIVVCMCPTEVTLSRSQTYSTPEKLKLWYRPTHTHTQPSSGVCSRLNARHCMLSFQNLLSVCASGYLVASHNGDFCEKCHSVCVEKGV